MVGADFDPGFLTWLFEHASEIQQMPVSTSPSSPVATGLPAQTSGPHSTPGSTLQSPPQRTPAAAGSGRILSSALSASRQDSYKRKADIHAPDGPSKKRLSDHGLAVPSGPRAMGAEGRSLQSRLSGRAPGSLQVRGVAAVPPRPMGMAGNGIQGMQGVQGMQMQGMPGMGMSGESIMMECDAKLLKLIARRTTDDATRAAQPDVPRILPATWTAGNDGANDDDASQHGADGRNDDTHDGGES